MTEYAYKKEWNFLKLTGQPNRRKPDRMYLHAGSVHFLEFKAIDKKLQKLQDNGFRMIVVDSVKLGYQ